jgi:hypothetical protein
LLWPALLNGYPLVYSDTGAYLESGFTRSVPIDRPVAYGLLLWGASREASLWGPILLQAVLVAIALVSAWRSIAPERSRTWGAFLVVVAAVIVSPLAVEASLAIPDFTTPLALLGVAVLTAAPRLGLLRAAGWAALLVFSLAAHLSNLSVVTACSLVLLALSFARTPALRALRGRALLLSGLAIATWFGVAGLNAALGAPAAVSRAGAVIYSGRLVQMGLLDDILAAECDRATWKLCAARGELPATGDEFLWGDEQSPFRRTGGFENRSELSQIVRASFSKPRWVARQVLSAAGSTLRQLTLGKTEPWITPLGDEYWLVSQSIRRHLPREHDRMLAARQQQGELQPVLRRLDALVRPVEVLATAVVLLGFAVARLRRRIPAPARTFVLVLIGGVALNAAVCASLANPHDRYHARVIPLALFCAALVVAWLTSAHAVAASEE